MKTIKTFNAKTRIISLILSILIVFYLVLVSVFAESIDTDTGGEESTVFRNTCDTCLGVGNFGL